jgi:hypothetical protein
VSDWRWIVTPLEPFAACGRCTKALRLSREHLVQWRGKNYHLACLLDELTQSAPKDPLEATLPLNPLDWALLP